MFQDSGRGGGGEARWVYEGEDKKFYPFQKDESDEIEKTHKEVTACSAAAQQLSEKLNGEMILKSRPNWIINTRVMTIVNNDSPGKIYKLRRIAADAERSPYPLMVGADVLGYWVWSDFAKEKNEYRKNKYCMTLANKEGREVDDKVNPVVDESCLISKFFYSVRPNRESDWTSFTDAGHKKAEENYQNFLAQQKGERTVGLYLCENNKRVQNFFEARQSDRHDSTATRRMFRVAIGWFWLSDDGWKPYDNETSRVLEDAYTSRRTGITVTINQINYYISLLHFVQFRAEHRLRHRKVARYGPPVHERNTVTLQSGRVIHEEEAYPSYWGRFKEFETVNLLPEEHQFKMISNLMNQHIAKHESGVGLAPVRCHPQGYEILKVTALRSYPLWYSYYEQMLRLEKDKLNNPAEWKDVEEIMKQHPVLTGVLNQDINEVYLFHGTSADTAEKITMQGFYTRHISCFVNPEKSVEGMFGVGAYFAEIASKSNQYAACPCCNSNFITRNPQACDCTQEQVRAKGGYTMIISRVLLGNSYVVKRYNSSFKGQSDPPYKPNSTNPYDSIWAESRDHDFPDSSLNFREFIIFNLGQIYPEYVVRYIRVPGEPYVASYSAPPWSGLNEK